MEISGRVVQSNQTLSSIHPGTSGIDGPRNPVGGGDAGVAVRDIDGVIGGKVVPVQERVENRKSYARCISVAVAEGVTWATILLGCGSSCRRRKKQRYHQDA